MLSSVARRSTLMAGRRLVSTPITACLSTQATQQVYHVEDLLMNMHWNHLKDNVEEIRLLMNEPMTNHSLHPDNSLEGYVQTELQKIQDMVMESSSPDIHSIAAQVCGLKKYVRSQLYHLD